MQYEDTTTISTPEGVELQVRLAGFGSRFTAGVLDLLIKSVAVIAVTVLAGLLFGGVVAAVVRIVGVFLSLVVYDIVFEVRSAGATPGKRALGIQVLLDDGGPVGLRASAVRNLIRLVEGYALFYVPAIVSILVTRRNQRLGDLAAGTVVAREGTVGGVGGTGSAVSRAVDERLADWDVSAVSAEELAAVRSFLSRRYGFDDGARRRVARSLAERLAPKVAGAPSWEQAPERFLEQLESAKSARM